MWSDSASFMSCNFANILLNNNNKRKKTGTGELEDERK